MFPTIRNQAKLAGIALAAVATLLFATSADAQNVHLKGGANAEPSFTDLGLQLEATGALAGLGSGDVVILLTAMADVTATCTNPAGANQPPGQNPAPITVAGSQAIPADEVKNGNVSFDVLTQLPTTPIAGAPDCPNRRWTESITDLSFTSATITVQQPADNTVLVVTCTFSPPTSNGPVSAADVSCTSS